MSDLESKQLFTNHSKIVYGEGSNNLPEHLNGLGYVNILYLLLQIEVKKKYFLDEKKDINLLFIEEPEAHTHPQMQYVFSQKIQEIIKEINKEVNLQTFISTHSSHIVSQCNFSDLRYFKLKEGNIIIKNFYTDLEIRYKGEEEYFKFLKQYLTLYSSELFFAEKIIFIEGTTEKMLLPYFISQYDKLVVAPQNKISSQNISIIEVGANSKVFKHFLEFLEIKTLIITDIDTTKLVITPATTEKKESSSNVACPVIEGDNTSNYSIKEFLNIPDKTKASDIAEWFKKLKSNSLQDDSYYIKIAYQIEELGYHGRSFEDSFISLNLKEIIKYKDDGIRGIQHKADLIDSVTDFYNLTQNVLKSDGKSDFASSLLFLALTGKVEWKTPIYIKEGLQWIAK
ncbi:ATP-dependent nuclease [Chryseobacterium antibioticum]|uniref:ATP-dependent nuclease n=1 Tax=Chryseobacterium antibioticum TaxID=2728847 RepID=UPI00293C027E|nr:AAA family ATPase [Chryseobacterium antibioticum]